MKRLSAFFLALFFTSPAHAQAPAAPSPDATGMILDHFEPAPAGSEWFAGDSLDIQGHLRPALGIMGQWNYRPLVLVEEGTGNTTPILRQTPWVRLAGSMVFWNRLRLSASVPLQFAATGSAGATSDANGFGYMYSPPADKTSLGDVRVALDTRLTGERIDGFTLALGSEFWIPTGSPTSYTSDGVWRAAPRVAMAGDLEIFTYAARVGFLYRGRQRPFGESPVGDDVFLRVAFGLRLAKDRLVIGPELLGSTDVTGDGGFFSGRATPVELLGGAHYTFAQQFRVGAGGGKGLTKAFGMPGWRALVSFEWTPPEHFGPPDRDRDGFADADDACPREPGVRNEDPSRLGCPPDPDRDSDGIPDFRDACPSTAGTKTNNPATSGCPSDRDGDGVFDNNDACPDTSGVASTDPQRNGCPPDTDGDGIPDGEDACPSKRGPRHEDPLSNGCPDPDRDHDGIPNRIDACPDAAGKANADPKLNGCPAVSVKDGRVVFIQPITFKLGATEFSPEAEASVQALADLLKDRSDIRRIRIEGHTEPRVTDAASKKLSVERANALSKWLSDHGIEASRITTMGYGADRPRGPNDTEEGRRANARVEIYVEESR